MKGRQAADQAGTAGQGSELGFYSHCGGSHLTHLCFLKIMLAAMWRMTRERWQEWKSENQLGGYFSHSGKRC